MPDHMVSLPGMSPGMLNRERELSACRNRICPTGEAPLRAELGLGLVGLSRDSACSWGMAWQQGAPLFSSLTLTTLSPGMASLGDLIRNFMAGFP